MIRVDSLQAAWFLRACIRAHIRACIDHYEELTAVVYVSHLATARRILQGESEHVSATAGPDRQSY